MKAKLYFPLFLLGFCMNPGIQAAGLTVEDLVLLKSENMDESIIQVLIDRDGLGFTLGAPEMVELRSQGFSEEFIVNLRDARAPAAGEAGSETRPESRAPSVDDISLAEEYCATRRYTEAVGLLEGHLEETPDDLRASALLALCLIQAERWGEARQRLAVLPYASDDPKAHQYLAEARYAMSKQPASVDLHELKLREFAERVVAALELRLVAAGPRWRSVFGADPSLVVIPLDENSDSRGILISTNPVRILVMQPLLRNNEVLFRKGDLIEMIPGTGDDLPGGPDSQTFVFKDTRFVHLFAESQRFSKYELVGVDNHSRRFTVHGRLNKPVELGRIKPGCRGKLRAQYEYYYDHQKLPSGRWCSTKRKDRFAAGEFFHAEVGLQAKYSKERPDRYFLAAPRADQKKRYYHAWWELRSLDDFSPLATLSLGELIAIAGEIDLTVVSRFHTYTTAFLVKDLSYQKVIELGKANSVGAEVTFVLDDSPAAISGIVEGDVITAIEGEEVQNAGEFYRRISAAKPGDWLRMELFRNHRSVERKIRVERDDFLLSTGARREVRAAELPGLWQQVFPYGWPGCGYVKYHDTVRISQAAEGRFSATFTTAIEPSQDCQWGNAVDGFKTYKAGNISATDSFEMALSLDGPVLRTAGAERGIGDCGMVGGLLVCKQPAQNLVRAFRKE